MRPDRLTTPVLQREVVLDRAQPSFRCGLRKERLYSIADVSRHLLLPSVCFAV